MKKSEIIDFQTDHLSLNPWIIMKFVKRYISILLAIGILFMLIGYACSFLATKMYISQTLLLPEQPVNNGGGLSSLVGGLSGINNAEKIGALRSDIYPDILKSVPFALSILKKPVKDINNKNYATLSAFFDKQKKNTAWFQMPWKTSETVVKGEILYKLPEKEILVLSKEEESKVQRVMSMVNTSINMKSGIITIQCEMADPIVSAQVTQAASVYLMHYVEEYRTGKTLREVAFLEQRVLEAKTRQESSEYLLQQYKDRNRNPFLNVARIEEQRLQSDYTLAQSLYIDLTRRLEQSKIKVKEEQPIFKTLEPVKVSLATSKPRRLLIAAFSGILGEILVLALIVLRSTRKLA